jgi:hypothetical protein
MMANVPAAGAPAKIAIGRCPTAHGQVPSLAKLHREGATITWDEGLATFACALVEVSMDHDASHTPTWTPFGGFGVCSDI